MSTFPRDRLEWLSMLQQRMDEFFKFVIDMDRKGSPPEHDQPPLVDMFETATDLVLEIELPGCDRNEVSLKMCGPVLIVEGIKREEPPQAKANYICLERKFGRYYRIVEIPPFADPAGVGARFSRGLLKVTFPLIGKGSPVVKEIRIE